MDALSREEGSVLIEGSAKGVHDRSSRRGPHTYTGKIAGTVQYRVCATSAEEKGIDSMNIRTSSNRGMSVEYGSYWRDMEKARLQLAEDDMIWQACAQRILKVIS